MKTVKGRVSETFREKGSSFIGFLYGVGNIDGFERKLNEIKSKYHDATHHCYAYRIDPINLKEFAQDDGEPAGTAGLPILNQLKSFDVMNAAIIVVRYFGGTKLGKSGLIEAYGNTAKLCLQKGNLNEIMRTKNIRITYPYNRQNQIDQLKSEFELIEIESEYLERVTLKLGCAISKAGYLFAKLHQLEHLDIQWEKLGEGFVVK